jgi:hypothetical protein
LILKNRFHKGAPGEGYKDKGREKRQSEGKKPVGDDISQLSRPEKNADYAGISL